MKVEIYLQNETIWLTQQFFATVQNKLHWAITGQTAAELIASRTDSNKQNMGLSTKKNSPKDRGNQKNWVKMSL